MLICCLMSAFLVSSSSSLSLSLSLSHSLSLSLSLSTSLSLCHSLSHTPYSKCISRQAVGLEAPQTINRRPLIMTSTISRYVRIHTRCSCWRLEASTLEVFLWPLHVCNFHTRILAGLVDNVVINFSHRSPTMFRSFQLSKLFFDHYFF